MKIKKFIITFFTGIMMGIFITVTTSNWIRNNNSGEIFKHLKKSILDNKNINKNNKKKKVENTRQNTKENNENNIDNGDMKTIRVLLKTTGYKDILHDKASFSCGCDMDVIYYKKDENGNLLEQSLKWGKEGEVVVNPDNELLNDGIMKITPEDRNYKISINSIERNGCTPVYRGNIILSRNHGKITIVNELPIEEYLYSVVPSEMPVSFGNEALKVQAVCARSYAVSHLGGGELSMYDADVDDSTDYQVYNNSGEKEEAIQAVSETKGQIMKHGDEIVNAYFFATSCGYTTDERIWGNKTKEYIKSKSVTEKEENINLTDEETFKKFIKSNFDSFDKGNPWYRWKISYTEKELAGVINDNINRLVTLGGDKILTYNGSEFVPGKPSPVNKIRDIFITSRSEGGVANELVIDAENEKIKILSQTFIRNIFNPYGIKIDKCDGSFNDKMNCLPSGFFVIEKNDDRFTLYGGGFGHGVGMSQTAVKNMANNGMTYEDILKFFYKDIDVVKY